MRRESKSVDGRNPETAARVEEGVAKCVEEAKDAKITVFSFSNTVSPAVGTKLKLGEKGTGPTNYLAAMQELWRILEHAEEDEETTLAVIVTGPGSAIPEECFKAVSDMTKLKKARLVAVDFWGRELPGEVAKLVERVEVKDPETMRKEFVKTIAKTAI